jgi:hypothetical protein
MGFLLGKQPKAPDPNKTAATQAGINKTAAQDTLKMNAMDRTGPMGSSTFQKDANGNPIGITNTLSPGLQTAADNVTGAVGAQTGMLPTTAFDPNIDANGIRQSYVNQGLLAAQPEWARQDKNREITFTNRGLPIGSEAWTDAENQVGESRNQYLQALSNQAWQAGANEEQRQFGNQLTQYQLPQQMAAGGLGLLSGMNGLVPQAQQPQANVGSVDYTGMVNNNYKAQMDAYNSKMTGLGQLAGAGLGLLTAPLTGGLTGGLANTMLGKGWNAVSNMWNSPRGWTGGSGSAAP